MFLGGERITPNRPDFPPWARKTRLDAALSRMKRLDQGDN
jgi:hypothetical protein